jgi:hypothetical protein
MKGELAHKIMEHSCLVPGKYSRTILNKIINDEVIKQEDLPANINRNQINEIKNLYQEKLAELKKIQIKPRYLPFYHLIKDKYPSFIWNTDHPNNYLHAPRVSNLRPSLLSLLLGLVAEERDTLLHRKYSCITKLPNSVVSYLDSFMKESNTFYPPENEMNEVVKLLSVGINKNKVTLFIPICPDYAFKYTGNPQCPVEFTFSELGCGNGVIAQWILNTIKNLSEFFNNCNIETEFVIAMADFEAFAEDNLKTFGITKEEFLRRTFLSKEAFKNACPVPAKVIMFTELCDEKKWLRHIETVNQMFMQRNFGASDIDKNLLLSVVANRKPLYKKWYGEKESLEDYIQIALNQGMMYAAMGMVISEHYENCLVFAADNKVMRYFYSVTKKIPTLYLKNKYS